jgi:hypothetical protein
MDFSKFKTPDWLVIGGGLLFLISGFIDWFDTGPISSTAFEFTLTGLIPWILIVGAAVITFLRAGGILKDGGLPWTLIVLGVVALGTLLVLLRLIIGADVSDFVSVPDGAEDASVSRAGGMWLATIGAVAAAAGAFLGFQASGGNVRDLTDMEKMKSAFK